MENSSALQRLTLILEEAVEECKRDAPMGPLLLKVMGYDQNESNKLSLFFTLLDSAEREAEKLKNIRKKEDFLEVLKDIKTVFINNHAWADNCSVFASHLRNKNSLIVLNSLVSFHSDQYPNLKIEKEYLDSFKSIFENLQKEVGSSDLSRELRDFILDKIKEVLTTIERYNTDGTEGLERTAKDFIGDWIIIENKISQEDRRKPIVERVKTHFGTLNAYIGLNLLVLIGLVPDIYNFWVPSIDDWKSTQESIELKSINQPMTIQEILEEASAQFALKEMKAIEGKEEPKRLLPALEEEKAN
ncbi:hypothetical protein [Nodosilinea sp. FACHB-13]|uniref:hypothetical protein n=1 Tax=Cyanophyceae TaxID=3028117 RepID=UPI0019A3E316|nr:hypothetical protein [Nodosilinea sp. FACHB-13]MBD2107619.1 hypothetical protein [Nodosilinea sp. FACHB-13]